MRYRLIPTQGVSDPSIFVETDSEQALVEAAETRSAELGKPVLVVRYPESGVGIQALFTAGQDPNEKKRRVR